MTDSIRLNSSAGAAVAAATPQSAPATPQAAGAPEVVVAAAQHTKEAKAPPKFDPQKMLEQMQEVVERLNEQMKENNRNLGFSIDRKINTFVVTVSDSTTGEIVRQIPTDVVVKFAHSLEDMKGLLFNEKL